jgi:hypothetical protein
LTCKKRSYALLRWIDAKVRCGTLPLGSLRGALDAPHAAVEWLSRNAASLPAECTGPGGQARESSHTCSRPADCDHVFDALVASLVGRAAALGLTLTPTVDELPAARVEGWIALPGRESLEALPLAPS